MYGLIRSALRQPITVVVAVIGVIFFSVMAATSIKIDIFPELDMPTIYVAQPYGGMAPDKMDAFIATRYQDQFLYVSGIKNIETKTIQGLSLIKLTFYPGTDMAQSAAEVANQVTRAQSYMPQGTVPPQVVRFDASSIPVGQLVFESKTRSLNDIQDIAASRIRPMFSSIPGVSSPPPFGGNQRSIVIKIDPAKMRGYGLTAEQVVAAIANNNQPSAAGNIREGDKLVMTPLNSLIGDPQEFLDVPIRTKHGSSVYVRDIGVVEDAADITVGYALINGKRAVYIPVVKKSDASTVDVVNNVKSAMPTLRDAIPADVHINYEFDQSVYVMNALKNVLSEGLLGAMLTGLMVLLFLGDWRSALIVVLTIPIALATALVALKLTGQSLNIMTLSGLALAIGILVDEATVIIENIHQHFEMGKSKARAIWDASREMAFPTFLILLCILVVFAPAFMMTGIPRSMFLPLSLAVGFSMIASYVLAQTLVPVLSNWIVQHSHEEHTEGDSASEGAKDGTPAKGFEKFREGYIHLIEKMLPRRRVIIFAYLIGTGLLLVAGFSWIGTDILPQTNNNQFQLRMSAADGTRIEVTEQKYLQMLKIIDGIVGEDKIEISSAYVGTQPSSYGTSPIFVFTSGPHEAVLQLAFDEESDIILEDFKEELRQQMSEKMPDTKINFEPIELTEKMMSQGASTPVQIEVAAKDIYQARSFAEKIMGKMKSIDYLRDLRIAQPLDYPAYQIDMNRIIAGRMGINPQDVAKTMVASTSSSRFTEKNLWLDQNKGLAYQVQVEIPEHQMTKYSDLAAIPLDANGKEVMLSNIANIKPIIMPGEIDRKGPNKIVTIVANLHSMDLGSASKDVAQAVKEAGTPPRGVLVEMKGQVPLLNETLSSLQVGLGIAVIVIFLLLSANFQSFGLSTVVLSTIPAVLVGSIFTLLFTGSTLNLQSYMGLIMSVGVSVANALLLVVNAETLRMETKNVEWSAVLAARSRIRPILMTAIAMTMGMIPMASGLGEGGGQVAPLGRAVIGGLVASTAAALLVLPLVFTSIQKSASFESVSLDPEDKDSKFYQPVVKEKED